MTQLVLPLVDREPALVSDHCFLVLKRDERATLMATRYGPTLVSAKDLKVV